MPYALKQYLNEDKSNIKKIMVLEKDFLDSDCDILSGNNLDDLFKLIWNLIWKEFQIQKKKKEFVKKKKKSSESEDYNNKEDQILLYLSLMKFLSWF